MIHLSVIIPLYNVEKFLPKCLESVRQNNWKPYNVEILMVNDDSPDGSLAIAENFAFQHDFAKVIIQENKGLGGARNTGIINALGEYLFFLDSDDFLIPETLPGVLSKVLNCLADIVEFAAERVDENYRFIDQIFKKNNSEIMSGVEYVEKYSFDNSACNKLYRRKFLLENEIRFFEKTYIEDAPFNAEAFVKAKRVLSVSDIAVSFYQNADSITRSVRSEANLVKFLQDSIKVTGRIDEISNSVEHPGAKKILKERVSLFTAGIILMIIRSRMSYRKKNEYIRELRNHKLYPARYSSGIMIRNLFLLCINRKFLLNILLYLK